MFVARGWRNLGCQLVVERGRIEIGKQRPCLAWVRVTFAKMASGLVDGLDIPGVPAEKAVRMASGLVGGLDIPVESAEKAVVRAQKVSADA
jgi:hypothetical protein